MQLSTPIFQLKRMAKRHARKSGIPLNQALDTIAKAEGFQNWSLLSQKMSHTSPANDLFNDLQPSDMLLLGARPGHGKTRLALQLLTAAANIGRKGAFFTLEYSLNEVLARFEIATGKPSLDLSRLQIDCSDGICAQHIINSLSNAPSGSLVVIDFLQLLDQKRDNPPLADQIKDLKAFANKSGVIFICISQIDRTFETSPHNVPDISDVRLPNPIDLRDFTISCFVHNGRMQLKRLS